jgi:hypothetical protein
MSQKLLEANQDLSKLLHEGYELEIRESIAMVHHVPYVNSNKEVRYGSLVSGLHLAGDKTLPPDTHVIKFIGDHPCDKNGNILSAITNQSNVEDLGNGIIIQHTFSNRPLNGYPDYYEKFVTYINIIAAPAVEVNPNVCIKTHYLHDTSATSVFCYPDTNSSKASIGKMSEKLNVHNIGIIGLGGTGSYVLDLIAKTPVKQINLYDGDIFAQHNAFRSPGAASKEDIQLCVNKAEFFKANYSLIHNNIVSYNEYLDEDNIQILDALTFVFVCIDNNNAKKIILEHLVKHEIPFIDVGIGLQVCDNSLLGHVRVTVAIPGEYDKSISFIDLSDNTNEENLYNTNIQVSDVNALNACLAVIQWKKYCGFYQDVSNYRHMTYSLNDGVLFNYETNLV